MTRDNYWHSLPRRLRVQLLLLILQSFTTLATAIASTHYSHEGHKVVGAVFAAVSWCSIAAMVVSIYLWSRDAGDDIHRDR